MKEFFKHVSKKIFIVCGLLLLTNTISLAPLYAADLTADEIKWLNYMREEEKLAKDVYTILYSKWESRVFSNIASSEQRHTDAIKRLLDRYGLEDPSEGKEQGEFEDVTLSKLYMDLINKGELSLVDALNVGVLIEKTDIEDLKAGVASTSRNDIRRVYDNLMQGSINHLNAFCSNLAKQGENSYCN